MENNMFSLKEMIPCVKVHTYQKHITNVAASLNNSRWNPFEGIYRLWNIKMQRKCIWMYKKLVKTPHKGKVHY